MSNSAIKIENLSKQYRLGVVGTGTLSHDIKRWWTTNICGKEDPYLKIGEKNDPSIKGHNDYVWALKDINLDVAPGEVLGIIGNNGAGKSTLLKILSKVTRPSSGIIKYQGRIASLLEVGTGFHSEMTGRENIYMNGAIMGMTKSEIRRKFDEIVDFSGVERYIDTPVKRYSSGMIVRLGFSIAAHLEPDILIVDEVLAVGDAEFQKKALGKMQNISKENQRTVLFVSHNMAAIENLCTRAVILSNGTKLFEGNVKDCINKYLEATTQNAQLDLAQRKDRNGRQDIYYTNVVLLNKEKKILSSPQSGEDITIRVFYKLAVEKEYKNCRISCSINSSRGLMFVVSSELVCGEEIMIKESGFVDIQINNLPLSKGTYFITLFFEANSEIMDEIDEAFIFDVMDGDFFGFGKNYPNGWNGRTVLIDHKFIFSK